jgi:hypothetical protein
MLLFFAKTLWSGKFCFYSAFSSGLTKIYFFPLLHPFTFLNKLTVMTAFALRELTWQINQISFKLVK